MNIISFFWKNGCWRDRRVKSSNLSISICWSDQKEEAYAETSEETEAYHTYLENRILKNYDKSFKREISKTSEAHRKMRNHRKMETQNQPGVQRYAPSMESVPAEEINWLS